MGTFLTVLVGSGIGAAIVAALFELWGASRQRKIDRLQQQLAGLYGPLYYFTSQNQALFDLYGKYHDAYGKEFDFTKYAEGAREKARKEAMSYLEAANSYIDHEVVKNDEKVMEVLREGWHLIDPDDVPTFSGFQIDYIRLLRSEEEDIATRRIVHEQIGDTSFMRPDMINRVRQKFEDKRAALDHLTRFPWVHLPKKR